MAFIVSDHQLGQIDLYIADTVGPGPLVGVGGTPVTYGRFNFPGMETRGYDGAGQNAGTFVFAKAVGAITPGTVCEYTQVVTSGRYDVSAQAWAGGAGSGKPLCVALGTLATGNWGWFQIEGVAQVTCQGAPVAGNPMYWQASGVVSPTLVASKQVLNAQFASAPAVVVGTGAQAVTLGATTALAILNRPFAQGQIT